MTSTERKRLWRLRHPERSAHAERERAKARRTGYWTELTLGCGADSRRLCTSSASYWRYEHSAPRYRQRMWYPRYGAGAHLTAPEEFKAAGAAVMAQAMASAGITLDSIWQDAANDVRRGLDGLK